MLALVLLLCCCTVCTSLSLPSGPGAVAKQAAASVRRAFDAGLNHQTVSLPLSEAIYGDREEGFVADRAIGWQGGPQETFRYLLPLAIDFLKQFDRQAGGLPPRVSEQLLLDFDGSALLTCESAAGPLEDVQAILPAVAEHRLAGARDITGHEGQRLVDRVLKQVDVIAGR